MPASTQTRFDREFLDAAARIAEDRGLGGLTIRPLAQSLGVSVSKVTNRFGQKSDILLALCRTAAAAEAELLLSWRNRIGAGLALPNAAVADFADAVIEDLVRQGRASTRICCEMIQAAGWQAELRAPIAQWLGQRRDFWSFLTARAASPLPFDLGEALHAFAIDELGHGLALDEAPAYRWLRKLALGRLCMGLFVGDESWDAASFDVARSELGDAALPADRGVRYAVAPRSEMVAQISPEISALILEGGSEAVTHRSVGHRVGIAATTLVYHFPRQTDLLKAGLEDIILQLHSQVDEDARRHPRPTLSLSQGMTIAVATFAVALAASRFPELRPFAADMRRRRGENGLLQMRAMSTAPDRIDMLTAQSIAVAAAGASLQWRSMGHSDTNPWVATMVDLCKSPV